eukprot:9476434-Pyramimonas_sp.AAC.1
MCLPMYIEEIVGQAISYYIYVYIQEIWAHIQCTDVESERERESPSLPVFFLVVLVVLVLVIVISFLLQSAKASVCVVYRGTERRSKRKSGSRE